MNNIDARFAHGLERYELKYVVPCELIPAISSYVLNYCSYDSHSAAEPDHFYPVNSLYFDTRAYRFLEQRMWGTERRFNMRVRSYADGSEGPFYAEVKCKGPTCIRKFRSVVAKDDWPTLFYAPPRERNAAMALFLHLATSYAIEPKIFTCYRRRAFVSDIDDYARVTLDIDLRYRPQDPSCTVRERLFSLQPDRDCVHYDMPTVLVDEPHLGANVILELKATPGAVPIWMIDMVQRFELKQVGFSKYLNSTLSEHIENGWHYADQSPLPMGQGY